MSAFLVQVALAHFFAMASPGPDFFLVLRNALHVGRGAGVATSLGIMFAVFFHLIFCFLGIALIIQSSPTLFLVFKIACALYLTFLGIQALRTPNAPPIQNNEPLVTATRSFHFRFVRQGFLVNLSNPKATLFFWSLFALLITPEIPRGVQLIAMAWMLMVNFLWFAFVATAATWSPVQRTLQRFLPLAARIMGAILILLAIQLALAPLGG